MRKISLIFIAVLFSFSAFAGTQNPAVFKVSPQTLKARLLEQNVDLALQLNQVFRAKDNVDRARRNLLPGVNLGAVLDSSMGFSLTSVSFLLPFLLPSNWLDLKTNQYLLNAQGDAYYIAQLNAYSSAYALYSTIQGDLDLRDVLKDQAANYKQIEDVIKMAVDAGMMEQAALLQARAQTQLTSIQVSQVEALIIQEKAAIREMLALPLSTQIDFQRTHVLPSSIERQGLQTIVDQSLAKSPEVRQLASMRKAADAAKWSSFWSFLGSASMGKNRGPTGSFSDYEGNGSMNFNFGNFLILKIGDRNIAEIELQKKNLVLDQAQLVESTIGTLKEAQLQLELAVQAENNLRDVYNGEVMKFQNGLTDLLHVLNAGNTLTSAFTNRIKAQASIDSLRVSLHRLMISDQFSLVEQCRVYKKGTGGLKGKLGRIFNPNKDKMTLDQACGPQVSEKD
ncbi:MAG: TolC family protein [Bdellovibrio sp.]|nr:TolC family protein [Bdellovibrio sp.]